MILIAFLLMPLGMVVEGITISYLWAWFVARTFSLPEITIMQGLGLSLLVSCLTYRVLKENMGAETEEVVKKATHNIAATCTFLLYGWLLHWFL